MSTYRTVIVGTDGSDSSLRAVDRAGAIAAAANANLIVATAHFPHADDLRAADYLKDAGHKMVGKAPVYAVLRDARDRAKEAGAADIKERAILGAPVEALLDLVDEVDADLLVVGSVGMSTVRGGCSDRCPPASRTRPRSTC